MHQQPYTVTLSPGRPISLALAAGQKVCVLSGTAWVTQSNDPQDHVLHAQQQWMARGGRVVVEALSGATRVQLQVWGVDPARNGAQSAARPEATPALTPMRCGKTSGGPCPATAPAAAGRTR